MNKKDEIIRLLNEGKSVSEIVSLIKCSKGTVSYYRKEIGLIYENPRKPIDSFHWNVIQQNYDEGCLSVSQICKKYNISRNNLLEAKEKGLFNIIPQSYNDYEVFVENSDYSRHSLKKRIIKQNLMEYKCQCCGLGDKWNNEIISLQLDHINGINNDNRIENLRFLCPNCHSQQDTYAAKNRKNNPNRVPKKYG